MFIDIGAVDADVLLFQVAGSERQFFQQPLHHGMQPPRANVFRTFVNLPSQLSDLFNAAVGKGKFNAFDIQ